MCQIIQKIYIITFLKYVVQPKAQPASWQRNNSRGQQQAKTPLRFSSESVEGTNVTPTASPPNERLCSDEQGACIYLDESPAMPIRTYMIISVITLSLGHFFSFYFILTCSLYNRPYLCCYLVSLKRRPHKTVEICQI